MSWTTLLVLAAGAYAFKAAGLMALGGRRPPAAVQRCLDLLPAALLPALIAVNTLAVDRRLTVDARAVGLFAAVVAAWRRLPFPVVIVLAALSTALTRRIS